MFLVLCERYNIIIVAYIYFFPKTIPLCSSPGSPDFAYISDRKYFVPWVIFRVIINHLKSTWKMEIRRGKQEREGVALKVPFKRLCACNFLIDCRVCVREGDTMRGRRGEQLWSEVEMNECQKLNWYSTNNEAQYPKTALCFNCSINHRIINC